MSPDALTSRSGIPAPSMEDVRQYKYRLRAPWAIDLGRGPQEAVVGSQEYVRLSGDGVLYFKRGYAWDGASGPTIDTPAGKVASLPHDGLYQLMEEGLLEWSLWRPLADDLLRDIAIDFGMWPFRARYWRRGVALYQRVAMGR